MDLSIIIVNWNSADYVKGCLRSIFAAPPGLSFEVIVIDSGSGDDCGNMIRRDFPGVIFIDGKENLGFPKANNAAYERAQGEAILFLNPDTEVPAGAIMRLWQTLRELPQAGIVGAKLLNSDGSLQTSCVQAFPTILNQMLDSEFLRRKFPRSRLWGMSELFVAGSRPREVDMVSGACLMIKRKVFDQVGRFSTYCFMYVEDMDLCLKARQAGWRTCLVPDALIVHHGGGSSARSVKTFSAVMAQESMRRFFACRRGRWHARAYTLASGLMAAQRCLLLAGAWVLQSAAGSGQGARHSLRKWLAILSWALGRETWITKYG